jgi:hypothetical protein
VVSGFFFPDYVHGANLENSARFEKSGNEGVANPVAGSAEVVVRTGFDGLEALDSKKATLQCATIKL